MPKSELVQTTSLPAPGPGDELIWGAAFDNKNVAMAVYHLGARKYGDLTTITEPQFLLSGLNPDEIAVIRRVLGAAGRELWLAPEPDALSCTTEVFNRTLGCAAICGDESRTAASKFPDRF